MIGRALLDRFSRARARAKSNPPAATARSHVGKVREINEDRFLMRSDRGLWAVADGMGGHSAGGAAASAAIAELASLADGDERLSDASLRAALDRANRRIRGPRPSSDAMSGTTVVVAWQDGNHIAVYWAGDSRAYLLRGGQTRCLTRDHSVVQELVDAGQIGADEVERHPYAHLVTKALGAAETVVLDKVEIDVRPGDRMMLCSDGVSRKLNPATIAGTKLSLAQFADGILQAALAADGSDNTTLVAIQLASDLAERAATDPIARRNEAHA